MSDILSLENVGLVLDAPKAEGGGIEQPTQILRGLSWSIQSGECLAIIGESGCGKSASLLSILGLHGENVQQSGKIVYKGQSFLLSDQKKLSKLRGKEIAIVFQDPQSALNPTMTIGEQIMEAIPDRHLKSKSDLRERVFSLLSETGIQMPEQRVKQYPFEFSGGMLQRVAIAIALAGEPAVLMADEPTTALDVSVQKQVLALLKGLQEKRSMSLVLVSHDLAVVSQVADRVLVMYAGECVEEANIKTIVNSPKHPYTQALLESIPSLSLTKNSRLKAIQGQAPNIACLPTGCSFVGRCTKAMNICAQQKPELQKYEAKGKESRIACWLYTEAGPLNAEGE